MGVFRRRAPKGLQNKIFMLCIMLVVTAITAFAVVAILQLRSLSQMSQRTGIDTNQAVKEMSEKSMMDMTRERMLGNANYAADYVGYEFWVFYHELSILSKQVKDIYDHPENYSEAQVHPPLMKDAGEYSLQLLTAKWADPEDEKELSKVRRLANLEPMMKEIVSQNESLLLDCYISLPSGYTLAMDRLSDSKYEKDGSIREYDATTRDWYKGAVENRDIFFTAAMHSYFYGVDEIAFGLPVYDDTGELICVLEGSTKLDTIRQELSKVSRGKTAFSILVNENGQIIYSPYTIGELAIDEGLTANIKDGDNEQLRKIFEAAASGKDGFDPVTVNGLNYYAAYAFVDVLRGAAIFFVSEEEIYRPTQALLTKLDTVSQSGISKYADSFRTSSWLSLLVVVLLVVNAVIVAVAFSGRLLKPILLMTRKVEALTGDNLEFEMEDAYRTGDEIEVLANAFGNLSEKTRHYIDEVMEMTTEKERISAELDIATRIQEDMLPSNFPLFPDRHEFDLFASMNPAKEVGGDFYDAFLLDNDHLCMVVGDVSGKGVPAALFMVVSKTMIKNRAKMGGTPAQILADVNNSLNEGNSELMFVTVWLGILTISTGDIIESNGGHEYPLIQHGRGDFELFKRENGVVLGAMEDMEYEDDIVHLDKGDAFFMYSDGLPEATNGDGDAFKMEGMISSINHHKDDSNVDLLAHITEDVKKFEGDAPQFDDLTMLIVRYAGPKEKDGEKRLRVPADVDNIEEVYSFIEDELENIPECTRKDVLKIHMVVDEIFNNIASYAYPTVDRKVTVIYSYDASCQTVRITFMDEGIPYDPMLQEDPDRTLSLRERQIGGLGVYMVKNHVDNMAYERRDGWNVLTLEKKIG